MSAIHLYISLEPPAREISQPHKQVYIYTYTLGHGLYTCMYNCIIYTLCGHQIDEKLMAFKHLSQLLRMQIYEHVHACILVIHAPITCIHKINVHV